MAHLALLEAQDGDRVTWMEHVTDEDYALGADAERGVQRVEASGRRGTEASPPPFPTGTF